MNLSHKDIVGLIDRLGSYETVVRMQAESALIAGGNAVTDCVLEGLEQEVRKQRRRRALLISTLAGLIILGAFARVLLPTNRAENTPGVREAVQLLRGD